MVMYYSGVAVEKSTTLVTQFSFQWYDKNDNIILTEAVVETKKKLITSTGKKVFPYYATDSVRKYTEVVQVVCK